MLSASRATSSTGERGAFTSMCPTRSVVEVLQRTVEENTVDAQPRIASYSTCDASSDSELQV